LSKPLVIVTDGATPRQHERTVAQVLSAVGSAAEVVSACPRSSRLPARLARRAAQLPGRTAADVAAAVERATCSDRDVVVLRRGGRLAPGWLRQVLEVAGRHPDRVGVLGDAEPWLEVHPATVRSADAPRYSLTGVDLRPSGADESAVTLSASLIVKDEATVIAACLDALRPFVDEIVVYDTGSTDDTVAIARAHGARVVEGYWDNHFGDARNRALAECTSDWILAVDADEVVTGDPVELRAFIAREKSDLVGTTIVNTTWSGGVSGREHLAARLFRRARGTWAGAVHEQVVHRPGSAPLVGSAVGAPIRLLHSGYQTAAVNRKGTAERNLAIARAAVDALVEADPRICEVWCNYGRALSAAGRFDEALSALRVVREHPTEPRIVLMAARAAVLCLAETGRSKEAEEWVSLAADLGEAAGLLALWRANAAMADGDLDAAQRHLSEVTASLDPWGMTFDPDRGAVLRAEVLRRCGEASAAVELLVEVRRRNAEQAPLDALLHCAHASGTPYEHLLDAMPAAAVDLSLREVVSMEPGPAHRWCEALWEHRKDRRAVVAGSVVARRMSMHEVLVWALRAREAGLPEHCPLRAIAADEGSSPARRAVATAVLAEVLLEGDAAAALPARLDAVPADQHDEVLQALAAYAPALAAQVEAA